MNRYQIKAQKTPKTSELVIYGDIGDTWDQAETNDALSVVKALADISDHDLTVRINSYGGVVADGLAIFNALQQHEGVVTARVDGVAFSIASLIAMGADTVQMADNALLMIHAPWGGAVGNAADMRDMADTLDLFAGAMENSYIRTGVDRDTVKGWLSDGKDHYFTAEQAYDAGLADEITESIDIAAALRTVKRFIPPQGIIHTPEQSAMSEKPDTAGGSKVGSATETVAKHNAAFDAGIAQGAALASKRINALDELFGSIPDPDGRMAALCGACKDDPTCTIEQANGLIVEAMKARTNIPLPHANQRDYGASAADYRPGREQVQGGADQIDKLIKGATLALEIRAGLETDQETIRKERNSEFMSMSLLELGKHCMAMEGKRVGGDRHAIAMQILGASGPGQGTDHFPAILENIANKSVMAGYMASNETWNAWTVPGVLNDYRPASRVNKSLFDLLDKMEEFAAFKHGRFADVKQSIQGFLHGKSFSLSMQSLVNDDLGMLGNDAQRWGDSAAKTIGNAVFLLISQAGTGGYGQVMDEDGTVAFHADHANLIDTGSGAVPDKTTISAGRTAMITQTDPNNQMIAMAPRYLIHGTELTMDVFQLLNSQNLITGADGTEGERNAVQSLGLAGVEEHRIDGFVSTAWYLAGGANTVEVAFVGGQSNPRVERMAPGEIPGVTWQISIPFGVALLDWRSMYLNYGA